MIKKEIWIKIKGAETVEATAAEIKKLIEGGFHGDCDIKVIHGDTRELKLLPEVYQLSQDHIPTLRAKYGQDNVIFQEREVANIGSSYIPETPCDPLERIADALEGIESSLDRLNDTLDSITNSFQGRLHLNVAATVYEN